MYNLYYIFFSIIYCVMRNSSVKKKVNIPIIMNIVNCITEKVRKLFVIVIITGTESTWLRSHHPRTIG